ncbi:MAG TPA: SOS response-associated peptidase, partial [Terriglobales bacterium]|nr:SOS response-associated peptidase [Terriglobales bacterium]
RESFERRRCLIPADGFYEWRRNDRSKQAFHFGMKDGSLFAFAGIWDRSKAAGQPAIESCAILTSKANELLKDVHDRMPVILAKESYDAWLCAPASNFRSLMQLLVPFNSELMRRWPVGPAVNDPRNESSQCLEEVAEFITGQTALFD